MQWGDLATWAAAAVTLLSTGVAVMQTRKASRAAVAAEDAQDRAVAAADRSAQAHSTLAALAEVEAQKPPWLLRHSAGDTYEVVNDGPTPKFDVRAEGEPIAVVRRGHLAEDRLEAGSSLTFKAVKAMGMKSTKITALWRDTDNGEERTWLRELPARPPRR